MAKTTTRIIREVELADGGRVKLTLERVPGRYGLEERALSVEAAWPGPPPEGPTIEINAPAEIVLRLARLIVEGNGDRDFDMLVDICADHGRVKRDQERRCPKCKEDRAREAQGETDGKTDDE